MNIYSTTFISTRTSIFSVFITFISSLLLIQICEAIESGGSLKAPELNLSTELHKKFYETIVVPMVRVCADKHFGFVSNEYNTGENVNLCDVVRMWNASYTDPPNAAFLDGIRRDIKLDTEHLTGRYAELLDSSVHFFSREIRNDVREMAEKNLIVAFRATYEQFKKAMAKYSGQIKEGLTGFQKLVYRLLCIGALLGEVIKDKEWQQALAYKQFAINLAIHSLHIEPPKSVGETGEILNVSENWMKIDEELKNKDIPKIDKRFYGTVVVPLVRTCDWHFGFDFKEYRVICTIAKNLQKSFLEWDRLRQKLATNSMNMSEQEIKDTNKAIPFSIVEIRNVITLDRNELNKTYSIWVKNKPVVEQIINEVKQIANEKENRGKKLLVEFKAIYEKFKKDAKKRHSEIDEEAKECRKDGYKMICIMEHVHTLYGNDIAGKQALAYQQFAINLALHSLLNSFSVDGNGKREWEQISENWIEMAELKNVPLIHKRFYASIVVPLVRPCYWHFGKDFAEDSEICKKVKALQRLFLEWDSEEEKATNSDRQLIAKLVQEIRQWINYDMAQLSDKYYNSMDTDVAEPIKKAIEQIGEGKENRGKYLSVAFKTSYEKFDQEAQEYKKGEKQLIEYQKAVYTMLYTGQEVRKVVYNNEEKQVMAYKLFAINLFVHALDSHKFATGDNGAEIEKIAKSWMQTVELNNLTGMHKRFYEKIVVPLVHKCDWHFGVEIGVDRVAMEEQKIEEGTKLCGTVEKLYELFLEWDREAGKATNPDPELIANVAQHICDAVNLVMIQLSERYYGLMGTDVAEPTKIAIDQMTMGKENKEKPWDANFFDGIADGINQAVREMTRERLIMAFRANYEKFKKEAAIYNNHKEEQIEFQKLVYRLLCIGEHLRDVIKDVEDKLGLAYRQYAINLAIHSLHIEHQNSFLKPGEAGGIQKISENFMKIYEDLNYLNGVDKRFYGTVVVPLMRTCDWHFGFNFVEDKFVCEVVKKLQKSFLQWDIQQQQLASNSKNMSEHARKYIHYEIANITAQIRQDINTDRNGLKNVLYRRWLEEALADQIMAKVRKNKGTKLLMEFKSIYEKFKKDVTKMDSQRAERIECVGYEMLCIGEQVRTVLDANDTQGKLELAYQQFAINLALHALYKKVYVNAYEKWEKFYVNLDEKWEFEEISEHWIEMAELKNLTGMHKRFYDTIVVPLVHKCDWHFGVEIEVDRFAKDMEERFENEVEQQKHKMDGGKKLCGTVKKLYDLFIELDGECENVENSGEYTRAKHMAARDEVVNIIAFSIIDDWQILLQDCLDSLTPDSVEAIKDEVSKIGIKREDLTAAFNKTFAKMIGQLKKVGNAGETTMIESREVACKLLLIGSNMQQIFDSNNMGRQQWAFQQFVLGLVVYSLRLDHPTSVGEGEILKIAERWPIGTKKLMSSRNPLSTTSDAKGHMES